MVLRSVKTEPLYLLPALGEAVRDADRWHWNTTAELATQGVHSKEEGHREENGVEGH